MKKKLIALTLISCITGSALLCGCNAPAGTNTSHEVTSSTGSRESVLEATVTENNMNTSEAYLALSANLLRLNYEENTNMLVSPASVEFALAMAMGAADNETLAQMQTLLGGEATPEEVYAFCQTLMTEMTEEENASFHAANSVWVNENKNYGDFNPEYEALMEKAFGAELNTLPFDEKAEKEINNWVSENTNEMIPGVIENIDTNSAAYLINALSFEAVWANPYEPDATRPGTFRNEDGTTSEATFMDETMYTYYETANACGFRKEYADGKYAFLAILPNEDITLKNYLETFDADAYLEFCESETGEYMVSTSLPKFEYSYSNELSEQLMSLGMTNAFDPDRADFGRMFAEAVNTLFISKVIHKTAITVDTEGTRAAAVTAIEIRDNCALVMPEKEVTLDRPFVYAIIDTQTNLPIFLGTVNML